ncbi:cop9 signalosome complex subunit, putative [Trypanosoma brucei gambiense DAL972]|uniref:COP9 signalosome complex subunit 4 n=2 Tax=Trypanosoma brucei TaxID=5691 RepID=D0A3M1_TRYB9|nr:cop9 signalosome complex subunit, putative [Trypanosoma brucei gambiense DAL972]CBH15865.1 cop9 signalosome complex subunit, putative [Trypanosoma brucei gambiense DAL972]|eukprot:XP_011778129.1 cop9 signalosome complex subunit, putative [Trypanosoma brucei gambiense DAL972]
MRDVHAFEDTLERPHHCPSWRLGVLFLEVVCTLSLCAPSFFSFFIPLSGITIHTCGQRAMIKEGGNEVGSLGWAESQAVSLVATGDLDGWRIFVQQHLEGAARADIWAVVAARSFNILKEMVITSPHCAPFALEAGIVLLGAHSRCSTGASPTIFAMRETVAEWCVLAGNERLAQQTWCSMLPAKDDVVSLEIVTKILSSALRTRDYAVAEAEYPRGISLYKALSEDPTAATAVNGFLYYLGTVLMAWHRFTDASLRFAELYERTKDATHLQLAVVSVIQSDASPVRTRRLRVYQKDENALLLGDLQAILNRAAQLHLLRPSELQCFLQLAGLSSDDDVAAAKEAFAQHNLEVVSQMYCNATFERLGVVIGITPADVERLVSRMVSEHRLDARLDQVDEVVIFNRLKRTSVLEDWDGRISIISKELSHAVDLITGRYPELFESPVL